MFPFRNLATKCDLFCSSEWYRVLRETKPLESLRPHLVGSGGNTRQASSWPVGRMSDSFLQPPELHRTAWCCQCWMNQGAESTKHGEPGCGCSKGPGLCASSWVTHLGPRRRKGKSPIGKRSWLSPGTEMESKALKPTPEIKSVQSFPKPDGKKVKARFRLLTLRKRWQMLNAMNWMKL